MSTNILYFTKGKHLKSQSYANTLSRRLNSHLLLLMAFLAKGASWTLHSTNHTPKSATFTVTPKSTHWKLTLFHRLLDCLSYFTNLLDNDLDTTVWYWWFWTGIYFWTTLWILTCIFSIYWIWIWTWLSRTFWHWFILNMLQLLALFFYQFFFFFSIGIHSMRDWTATMRHGVTRKRSTKRLQHTENLFRKNLQLKDEGR